jgi:hypothetical protein
MITVDTDRLVDDYLRRLEEAAAHLQRSRRTELVAAIREHIDAALREKEAAGEAAVRNVLERLGTPEQIVDAAEPPPREERQRAGKLELAALIALVVPLIGWLFGIALVVASQAWSRRDKLIGVALALLPAVVPLVGIVAGSRSGGTVQQVDPGAFAAPPAGSGGDGSSFGPLELTALMLGVLAGIPSALFLGWRLRS